MNSLHLFSIFGFLITILFIVGVHEFGHFIVARMVGIKVLRFSIGFGKRLYHWHGKTGTEYVIAIIPLGGYVKMVDEREGPVDPADLPLAFNRQSIWKRFLVVAAGPFSNFIFAILVFWLMYLIGIVTPLPVIGEVSPHSIAAEAGLKPQQVISKIGNKNVYSWMAMNMELVNYLGSQKPLLLEATALNQTQNQKYQLNLTNWHVDDLNPDPIGSLGITPYTFPMAAVVGKIIPHTPAATAKLQVGDQFLAINNKPVSDWLGFFKTIRMSPEKNILLTIKRNNNIMTIPVTTEMTKSFFSSEKHGYLGIEPDLTPLNKYLYKEQYNMWQSVLHAYQDTVDLTWLNFLMVGKMITGKVSLKSLGGPISIFESAGYALNAGMVTFLSFLGFISIAVGFVNLLPIPGLDGGHVFLMLIEGIRRQPFSVKTERLLLSFGIILLLLLIVQAVANDVMRI